MPILTDQITDLYTVADDDEADIIERLAIKAGHRWQCSCGWVSYIASARCEGQCGLPRPEVRI